MIDGISAHCTMCETDHVNVRKRGCGGSFRFSGNDGFMIFWLGSSLYLTTKGSHERYLRFVQVFHSLRAWIMGNGKKIK